MREPPSRTPGQRAASGNGTASRHVPLRRLSRVISRLGRCRPQAVNSRHFSLCWSSKSPARHHHPKKPTRERAGARGFSFYLLRERRTLEHHAMTTSPDDPVSSRGPSPGMRRRPVCLPLWSAAPASALLSANAGLPLHFRAALLLRGRAAAGRALLALRLLRVLLRVRPSGR